MAQDLLHQAGDVGHAGQYDVGGAGLYDVGHAGQYDVGGAGLYDVGHAGLCDVGHAVLCDVGHVEQYDVGHVAQYDAMVEHHTVAAHISVWLTPRTLLVRMAADVLTMSVACAAAAAVHDD